MLEMPLSRSAGRRTSVSGVIRSPSSLIPSFTHQLLSLARRWFGSPLEVAAANRRWLYFRLGRHGDQLPPQHRAIHIKHPCSCRLDDDIVPLFSSFRRLEGIKLLTDAHDRFQLSMLGGRLRRVLTLCPLLASWPSVPVGVFPVAGEF